MLKLVGDGKVHYLKKMPSSHIFNIYIIHFLKYFLTFLHPFLQGIPYLRDAESVIGFKVDSLMCMPIRNSEDDVIGVALVLNKMSRKTFTEDDEKVRK